ncbi:Pherokine 3 [Carabus blaptoides fortunei]
MGEFSLLRTVEVEAFNISSKNNRTMQFIIVFALCCVAFVYGAPDITNRFDHIDIDEVLRNDRLIGNYIKCVLDTGRCTAEGQELKKVLPDAIKTGCAECNAKQEDGARKVLRHLSTKRKNDWNALLAKFDPNGQYYEKYQHYLE